MTLSLIFALVGFVADAPASTESPYDVTAAVFSKDYSLLLTGHRNGTAYLWNMTTGQAKQLRQGHTVPITAVAIAPDKKTAATGDEGGKIVSWNLTRSLKFRPQTLHTKKVLALLYSDDGRLLASTGEDCRIAVWKTEGRAVFRDWHTRECHHWQTVSFSPSGKKLVAACSVGVINYDVENNREMSLSYPKYEVSPAYFRAMAQLRTKNVQVYSFNKDNNVTVALNAQVPRYTDMPKPQVAACDVFAARYLDGEDAFRYYGRFGRYRNEPVQGRGGSYKLEQYVVDPIRYQVDAYDKMVIPTEWTLRLANSSDIAEVGDPPIEHEDFLTYPYIRSSKTDETRRVFQIVGPVVEVVNAKAAGRPTEWRLDARTASSRTN